jgi:hypothetical protein
LAQLGQSHLVLAGDAGEGVPLDHGVEFRSVGFGRRGGGFRRIAGLGWGGLLRNHNHLPDLELGGVEAGIGLEDFRHANLALAADAVERVSLFDFARGTEEFGKAEGAAASAEALDEVTPSHSCTT